MAKQCSFRRQNKVLQELILDLTMILKLEDLLHLNLMVYSPQKQKDLTLLMIQHSALVIIILMSFNHSAKLKNQLSKRRLILEVRKEENSPCTETCKAHSQILLILKSQIHGNISIQKEKVLLILRKTGHKNIMHQLISHKAQLLWLKLYRNIMDYLQDLVHMILISKKN